MRNSSFPRLRAFGSAPAKSAKITCKNDTKHTVSDAHGADSGSFAGAIHPAGYRQETGRSGQGHQERPDGGRQRLDAHQLGAGADDDRSGAGAVLRRPGAQEERAGHHDAQLYSDGHGFHSVGGDRLQPGVRRRERVFRRSALSVPQRRGRRSQPGLRGHHSASDVHDLPADVRHHHSGADLRGVRRADEVLGHAAVHDAVVVRGVLPDGAHGVGQGRAAERVAGRRISGARFRGWNGGAHYLGRFGAGLRAVPGQAQRLSGRIHAAAQRGAERDRSLPAVGGLVRIQRGQRGGGRIAGIERVYRHALRHGRGGPGVDDDRMDDGRQAQRAGRDLRSGGRVWWRSRRLRAS